MINPGRNLRMAPPDVTQQAELEPMRVLEIEIARPLSPLSLIHPNTGQRYSRALCLIRANTQPLGLLELKGDSSAISPDEYVPEIWQALGPQIVEYLHKNDLPPISTLDPSGLPPTDKLPKHLQERQKLLADAPFVSVVIATRERPESIARCLTAFLNLEYPRYEIIVVDNAPTTNATAEVIKEFCARMPHLRYAREELPGLSRGRNRGLKAARGEIVAFADDDIVPDPHWLTEIVRGFQAGLNVAGVTGLILPAELDTPPQFWFEQFGGFNKGFSRCIYDLGKHRPPDHMFPYAAGTLGSGANMAFKTSFLRDLGGLDPALGAGSLARSGEELVVFVEVILRGYQLAYEPGALIYHSHHRHS